MKSKISGRITSVFSDDINTDHIVPAWTLQESTERKYFANYAFANYDSGFIKRCAGEKSNIIVAGEYFGCGSSREQAVYALQENRVTAVIAKSFPDIFYRNCLNNGLSLITVPDIAGFKLKDSIEIDLEKKQISVNKNKKISFKMPEADAKLFALGGKLAAVQKHLAEILQQGKYTKINYWQAKKTNHIPQTIVEKIISDHLGKTVSAGDKIDKLPIDLLFFNDVIAPPAIAQFQKDFSRVFQKMNSGEKVFDPKRIFFIPDHTVPSSSVAVSEGIDFMEKFAVEAGIKCYKEGDGIEHVVLIEDGYIVPGSIILGTDSHTDTNGALNALALGIGTSDASFALATGHLYDFRVPETIRINLTGKFSKGVSAKDLILTLIGKMGVDGAVRRIVEFGGPALMNMSMDERTTVANMAVEMGARTAIFDHDRILEKYLAGRAKFPYKTYSADKDFHYEKVITVELATLEPTIAFPHKPANTTSIGKIKEYMKKSQESTSADFARVNNLKITDAFLGACTNGRFDDFLEAAKIIKGRKVHPKVNFVVIPASRKVYNKLLEKGLLKLFADAGANIESSNCCPCFGKHMGVVGRGAQMISSSNRNYIGRMGSKEAKIFLASPASVTAAAVSGEITDPRKFL